MFGDSVFFPDPEISSAWVDGLDQKSVGTGVHPDYIAPQRVSIKPSDFEMTLFIREKLQEVFMQTGTTMLLVSHDLEEAVYLADEVLLLTKRPTRVAEILPYTDARPRTIETLTVPSFIHAKKRSLEVFQREVRR